MVSDLRKLLKEANLSNWSNIEKLIEIKTDFIAQWYHEGFDQATLIVTLKNVSKKKINNLKIKITNENCNFKILHHWNIEYDQVSEFWVLPEWKIICGGIESEEIYKFNITVNNKDPIINVYC